MIKRILLVLVLLMALFSFAFSQVEQGDKEILFSGTLTSIVGIENYSAMNIMLNLSYGYFVTDNLQLGIGPMLSYSRTKTINPSHSPYDEDEEVINEETNVSGYAFFNFNFSTSGKTVPYISGQWYQFKFKPEEGRKFSDYSYANIGIGVRNFITEYAALNTSANYGFSLSKDTEGGILLVTTGLSLIF